MATVHQATINQVLQAMPCTRGVSNGICRCR